MSKRIHRIANEIGDPTTELGQRVRVVVDTMIPGGLIDWLRFSIPELRSEHELWFNQFELMPWVDDRLAVIAHRGAPSTSYVLSTEWVTRLA